MGKSFVWNLIGVIIAGIWMLAGYYGAVIGLPLAAALKKINIK
jgi:hypothetical protein